MSSSARLMQLGQGHAVLLRTKSPVQPWGWDVLHTKAYRMYIKWGLACHYTAAAHALYHSCTASTGTRAC